MKVVPLYAALLAIFYVVLSVRTISLRRELRVGLGDAGDPRLLRAIRVHGNFAEYVPLTLLLLWLMDAQGANSALLHALGSGLLVGRLAHALGVSREPETPALRVAGMAMTFTALLAASGWLLLGWP